LDFHAVPDFHHRHPGVPLEDFSQDAFVLGAQVLDDHEAHAAVRGHVGKKGFQGLQAAGGGADAHHGKFGLIILFTGGLVLLVLVGFFLVCLFSHGLLPNWQRTRADKMGNKDKSEQMAEGMHGIHR